jgi:hypothetical protein
VPYAMESKGHHKCIPPTSRTFINYTFYKVFDFMEKHFIVLKTLGRAFGRIMIGF